MSETNSSKSDERLFSDEREREREREREGGGGGGEEEDFDNVYSPILIFQANAIFRRLRGPMVIRAVFRRHCQHSH